MNKLVLLLVALLACTQAIEFTEEKDVIVLTDDNFDHAIKQHEHILVEFYAPWCGHCKKLAPELESAAATLKASAKPVPIAKVDATVQKKCSEPFNIKGFPTLKFFVNGEAIEYTGGRVADQIVQWITKRTGDASELIADQAALDSFKEKNPLAAVFFVAEAAGEQWEAYKKVAMSFDNVSFGHVLNADLATSNSLVQGNVAFYKPFDEKLNTFTEAVTKDSLHQWIDSVRVPTVMDFDDTAIEFIFQKSNPAIFLFNNNNDDSKAAIEQFQLAASEAKTNKSPVKFCSINPQNQHWQKLADYVGVNTAVVPSSMLIKSSTKDIEKYKFEGKFEKAEILEFLSQFEQNKLNKFVKSEDVPATNDKPVKVIVGKNFDDLVVNNNKDVLVKFYAPWCGHCKKLIPAWEEAAEKLEANPNIVIAKCDSTANEISSVQVQSFPTIKFFPGNNKQKIVDFNGDRTTEGILSWLKENTTHTWVDLDGKQEEEQKKVNTDL